jgi:transcriptional regulator with XRE-family HTH domain
LKSTGSEATPTTRKHPRSPRAGGKSGTATLSGAASEPGGAARGVPPAAAPLAAPDLAKIGETIRVLRTQRGLTLKGVASAANLSVGFLSQIERGLARPSLVSIYALADALSISPRFFLADESVSSTVSRAAQRSPAAPGESRVTRISMDVADQIINSIVVSLPPGYDSGLISHDGEKLLFVLGGTIEVSIGDELFVLGPSDSSHFRATLRHRIRNAGSETASVLCSANIVLAGGLS